MGEGIHNFIHRELEHGTTDASLATWGLPSRKKASLASPSVSLGSAFHSTPFVCVPSALCIPCFRWCFCFNQTQ